MKKLIREHIYEKFIQDSDPIADMGIGMKHQIKKWIETETDYYAYEQDLLWICSMHGKAEFVKYLLDAGADVHAGNDYSLQIASNNGHTEVVKILLDAGTNVHAEDNCALRWAKQNKHNNVVKILKDHIAKEKKNKTVKENLSEKFTEDSDPIDDMGIGIRHLIEEWIKKYRKLGGAYRGSDLADFVINDDGTIDVNGHVNLYNVGFKELPSYIQFNNVGGNFWINSNKLETLRGCPRRVTKNFFCGNNQLTSLEFAPKYVGGKFDCFDNRIRFSKKDVLKVCKVKSINIVN